MLALNIRGGKKYSLPILDYLIYIQQLNRWLEYSVVAIKANMLVKFNMGKRWLDYEGVKVFQKLREGMSDATMTRAVM